MPEKGSLNPQDTRNFIRNLRYKLKAPFKYFLVGEYGDNFDRPHYHALIFGEDFGLSQYSAGKKSSSDQISDLHQLHNTEALQSPQLNELWGLGFTSVGALTFDSAAYCAQYAIKKINGSTAKSHYGDKHPEFMRTSQNAIGKQYAHLYADEIINHNNVLANGQPQPIPQYYLKQYEKLNYDLSDLKQRREEFSETHSIEKSYLRAQKLDSKFKLKISKSDAFRIRYAKDRYFNDQSTKDKK